VTVFAEEAAPAATRAMERWFAGQAFQGYGEDSRTTAEDGFGAGFEAGIEWLRERVLSVWDMSGAWVPGGRSAVLAEALGVPKDRTLSHRHGGQSSPENVQFIEWLNS
jgi:hypothetical protein